jgi:ABC-type transport system substrate-binding protein
VLTGFADFIYRTHIIQRYGQKFLDACGPELTIQDWGVTYDELEPHYDRPLKLLAKAQETFVRTERDNVLASAHELIVDEAPWVWIVHDLNPRAMLAKVKGFRPAQSWFQDFTGVYMD